MILKKVAVWAIIFAAAGSGVGQKALAMDDHLAVSLIKFSRVLEELSANYVEEIEPGVLVNHAIHGMLTSLDPFCVYLESDRYTSFKDRTRGSFAGVGLTVQKRESDLVVVRVIENAPAFAAGMKTGDKIIRIDGEATESLDLDACVSRLKGAAGTPVELAYIRQDLNSPIIIRITRDHVILKSVTSAMLTRSGIAYLGVHRFQGNTMKGFIDALEDLESSDTGLQALVLDLRDNPGGHLEQAVEMADLFLEQGIIVTVKGRHKVQTRSFHANTNDVRRNYPMAVLINQRSASASEIVAGALQDHGRAVIVGTTSFGKGSVQTLVRLDEDSGFKYTIARYYTPHNRTIEGNGVTLDIHTRADVSVTGDLKQASGSLTGSKGNAAFTHDSQVLQAVHYLGKSR